MCQLTEAIVNPANVHLRHGSGAGRAIAVAAGPVLDEQCRQYIDQHGPLTVAEPMHTSAGRLAPAIQYVIHVAGPQSAQYSSPEQQQLCHQRLKQAFTNCLQYANSVLRVHSVSIPAISSGNSLTAADIQGRVQDISLRGNGGGFLWRGSNPLATSLEVWGAL